VTDFANELKLELARLSLEQNDHREFRKDVKDGPDSYERLGERQLAFREGFYHGARWAIESTSK